MKRKPNILAILIWIVLAAFGIWGVHSRLFHGHHDANYGSYVPWGLWVSSYIYFIGLSAGAFVLSSMINVFGITRLQKVGRIALLTAAVTLLGALLSIWFDLGHMERNYEVFTRPNFTSMMAWMIWLYTAYFILIVVELWFELRCDLALKAKQGGALSGLYKLLTLGWSCPNGAQEIEAARKKSAKSLRILGILGIPLAIAFHGGVGALFATLSARPYWHTGLFPILFLTGALVSGGALLLAMVTWLPDPTWTKEDREDILKYLRIFVITALVVDLVLEWSEISIPMWYAVGHEAALFKEILFGQYWYVFWIIHIGLGSLIPLLLLTLCRKNHKLCGLGGALIALTFLAVRLNLVIPGQTTPALKGLRDAYMDSRLQFSYVPSTMEWAVVAFVVAGVAFLFFLGRTILPMNETEIPSETETNHG